MLGVYMSIFIYVLLALLAYHFITGENKEAATIGLTLCIVCAVSVYLIGFWSIFVMGICVYIFLKGV
jgi:hypothetical protein